LGKPVIQIPGCGPQFTYRFAEAQMRLLGNSVHTVGKGAAGTTELRLAAELALRLMDDRDYLYQCQRNGQERVSKGGGALGIAQVLHHLCRD
jgi:uncharacterized protein (TIGR03492 family)